MSSATWRPTAAAGWWAVGWNREALEGTGRGWGSLLEKIRVLGWVLRETGLGRQRERLGEAGGHWGNIGGIWGKWCLGGVSGDIGGAGGELGGAGRSGGVSCGGYWGEMGGSGKVGGSAGGLGASVRGSGCTEGHWGGSARKQGALGCLCGVRSGLGGSVEGCRGPLDPPFRCSSAARTGAPISGGSGRRMPVASATSAASSGWVRTPGQGDPAAGGGAGAQRDPAGG